LENWERELMDECFVCKKCKMKIYLKDPKTKKLNDVGVKLKYILQMFLKAKEYKQKHMLDKAKEMFDGLIKYSNDCHFLHPLHIFLFNAYTEQIYITDALLTISAEKIDTLKNEKDKSVQFQELMARVVELTGDLLRYAKMGFRCARLILPPNMPELAGFLRAEYKSLMQLAQFAMDRAQRDKLLQEAQASSKQSKEIWRISRSGEEEMKLLSEYFEQQKKDKEKQKVEELKREKNKQKRREQRKKKIEREGKEEIEKIKCNNKQQIKSNNKIKNKRQNKNNKNKNKIKNHNK